MLGERHDIFLFVFRTISPIVIAAYSKGFNECRIKVQSSSKIRQVISGAHLEIDNLLVLIRIDYGLADLLIN